MNFIHRLKKLKLEEFRSILDRKRNAVNILTFNHNKTKRKKRFIMFMAYPLLLIDICNKFHWIHCGNVGDETLEMKCTVKFLTNCFGDFTFHLHKGTRFATNTFCTGWHLYNVCTWKCYGPTQRPEKIIIYPQLCCMV